MYKENKWTESVHQFTSSIDFFPSAEVTKQERCAWTGKYNKCKLKKNNENTSITEIWT